MAEFPFKELSFAMAGEFAAEDQAVKILRRIARITRKGSNG
jgi:hypothetical protein